MIRSIHTAGPSLAREAPAAQPGRRGARAPNADGGPTPRYKSVPEALARRLFFSEAREHQCSRTKRAAWRRAMLRRRLRLAAHFLGAAAGVGSVALTLHAESEPVGCARTIPDTLARTLYWQLKRHTPLGSAAIPYRVEHVNVDFMTKVMRHASPRELAACCSGPTRDLVLQRVPVVTKVATTPMGSGAGFASTMCRAEVTVEGSPTPIRLVVKMAPGDFESSLLFRLIRSGETEAEFYRSSVTEEAQLNTPGHLYVDHDRTSDQFVLVQRDVSPLTTASQANGATVEQAKKVLVELAKLNGCFFNNTDRLRCVSAARVSLSVFVRARV